MTSSELLIDLFERIAETVGEVLEAAQPEEITVPPKEGANSIAWLIWHLSRVQDDHIADLDDTTQVWISGGYEQRFHLPFDQSATGYGQTTSEAAAVGVKDVALFRQYHDAVTRKTVEFLRTVTDADLDRIVDESYDPPVSLGVRLVSVIADDLQHVGQAAYVRGLTRSSS